MLRTLAVAATLCAAAVATSADAAPRIAAPRADERSQLLLEGDVFVARGAYETAIVRYREALGTAADDAVVRNKIGMCHQRLGQLEQARREYQRALELVPDYAEVWNNLGSLHHALGNLDAAMRDYRRALEYKPLASAHLNLGIAYLTQEKVDEAFGAFRRAFALDPAILDSGSVHGPAGDLAKQYYFFAKLHAAAGRIEQALVCLEKAKAAGFGELEGLSQDPDFAAVVESPRFAALMPQS